MTIYLYESDGRPVPILRQTPKRIYYCKNCHQGGDHESWHLTGFVDRAKIESEGRVWIADGTASHWISLNKPE